MDRFDGAHSLDVTVPPGMVVRPRHVLRVGIVPRAIRLYRVEVDRMEVICGPHTGQRGETAPEILMIAGRHQPASSIAEANEGLSLCCREASSCVHRQDPGLVEVGPIDSR